MKQVFILDSHETLILHNALIKYFHPGNELINEDDFRVIQHLYRYLDCSNNFVDDDKLDKIVEIIYS